MAEPATTHLRRKAYIYVRQSTLVQTVRNTESLLRQYDLAGRARELGWAEHQIVVVDDDLGRSGASAQGRKGFSNLVADVGLGKAGARPGSCCRWNPHGWPATTPCSDIGTRRFVPRTDLCRVGTGSSCRVGNGRVSSRNKSEALQEGKECVWCPVAAGGARRESPERVIPGHRPITRLLGAGIGITRKSE